MTARPAAMETLGTKLCPWLHGALEQLEHAHSAQRLGHAWLLAGPEGVGKLNLALVFARRLLGHGRVDPAALGRSEAVAAMRARHQPADHHPDLHWIFPEEDKRAISVEQIRAVAEILGLKAFKGEAKVVIIEPAETMTSAAANALLKTLEEPAGNSYLLLLTHQPGRLTATIRSRCQRIEIRPPPAAAVEEWLEVEAGRLVALRLLAGRAPLRLAELVDVDNTININELADILSDISRDEADPFAVAERWLKLDVELVLSWLVRALHAAARLRLASAGQTSVTDPLDGRLHNMTRGLTLRAIFDQYAQAEALLGQLGSGINVELALKALLVGFQPNRGRP
jgi:DNA polymerase-3 subunit delta'